MKNHIQDVESNMVTYLGDGEMALQGVRAPTTPKRSPQVPSLNGSVYRQRELYYRSLR